MGPKSSPRILSLSWGQIVVDGAAQPFKDVKLFPGGSREWDWRETGTDHSAGIQPKDVEDLLDRGAEVVVLSRGMLGRLNVSREALSRLHEKGIEVHVLATSQAVEVYNQLRENRPVGALIHSTC